MNIKEIVDRYPDKNIFRIDLVIGEKDCWSKGIGSAAIALLVQYGFTCKDCDMIFGGYFDYNPRSGRAFQKAGFAEVERVLSDSVKAEWEIRLAITKEEYFHRKPTLK